MTRFLDGPAQGATLMLRRAPLFIRVTHSRKGFDALDQLNDQPLPEESLWAYVLKGPPGRCHIRAAKGASGFYPIAEYQSIKNQPPDEKMRDPLLWVEWVGSQQLPQWVVKFREESQEI